MINFRKIELSDKVIIDSCLAENTFRACDYCFTNLFSWQLLFKTSFDVIDETLFIRGIDNENNFFYMMPIGKMPLKNALFLIMEDAKKNNVPLKMKGITTRMSLCVEKAMPDTFQYSHDRENDEYIYFTQKLIELKGKKLQSKRNHINRFKADNPNWTYSTINSGEELKECIRMLDKWESLNIDNDNSETFNHDYIATKTMIENFSALQLSGGIIRIKEEIIAFTLGEKLTEDTFVIHVEKAFGEINGAYAIVNQQFAENVAYEYTYINREEDMGLENLRKAKMSYQPDIILEERILTLK